MKILVFQNQAYVHKLNAQELGYRNNIPGGAGRYFYISKNNEGFFPPLSETVLNDQIYLNVIPPHSNEVVLTKYVYHNSKRFEENNTNGRDEYRLYLNVNNDPGREYYKPGDIIIIFRIEDAENQYYKIICVKEGARNYERLLNLLEAVDTRYKAHALISIKELAFIDDVEKISLGRRVIPQEIINEALEEPIYSESDLQNDEFETTRIMRSRSFRDLVLYFYNYRCAITDKDILISYKEFNNLEAAHILARSAGGGNNPSNGIALERNLHWAFDKGFFTITSDYKVKVHEEAKSIEYLSSKDGANLIVPEDSRTKPNFESIKWHNDNVFGLFMRVNF